MNIPADCWGQIASHMTYRDLSACRCVSKGWRQVFSTNSIWKMCFQSMPERSKMSSNLDVYAKALYFKDWQDLHMYAAEYELDLEERLEIRLLEMFQTQSVVNYRDAICADNWASNLLFYYHLGTDNFPMKYINRTYTLHPSDVKIVEKNRDDRGVFVDYELDLSSLKSSPSLVKGLIPSKYRYQPPFFAYRHKEKYYIFSNLSWDDKGHKENLLEMILAKVHDGQTTHDRDICEHLELSQTRNMTYLCLPEQHQLAWCFITDIFWRELSHFVKSIPKTIM